MDATDVVLLGLVWAQFRRPDAGLQLVEAIEGGDPEIVSLAAAMLEQDGLCSKEMVHSAIHRRSEGNLESQLSAYVPGNVAQAIPSDFWWLPAASA
jgi:hypothetical protein